MDSYARDILKANHSARCGLITTLGKVCKDQGVKHIKKVKWRQVRRDVRDLIEALKVEIERTQHQIDSDVTPTQEFFEAQRICRNTQVELAVSLS